MAFDEKLALRVKSALSDERNVSERKMFGGIAFMVKGSMCVGVLNDDLVVRVAADEWERALGSPHARPMDFTGKPMKGFLYVAPGGTKTSSSLKKWIDVGLSFVATAPAKTKKPKKKTVRKR